MAEPLRILRNLDEITTRYTVFEKNQVLTHVQLNELANYLDDQERLTRVALLGVGIVCGLRVALQGDGTVAVSPGVGVTTQGDLLHLAAEARFDHFKRYDESAPVYEPFYRDERMLPVFELVHERERDDRAAPLDDIALQAGVGLEEMVALLLMESYVKDDDLCSGTDCDNLGQGSVHTAKVLLISRQNVSALQERLLTLGGFSESFEEIVAERPLLSSSITSTSALVSRYRKTCEINLAAILRALRDLSGRGLFSELLGNDPVQDWTGRLEAHQSDAARREQGFQYYYDFLKDLAETCNALRDLLWGDTTVCCPDLGAFPKHLLLGGLKGDDAALRTGFYPSPLSSRTADQRDHARFLAEKIGTMIGTFRLGAGEIRITPSSCEDRNLEERAIPYYYRVDESTPIYRAWNHALTRRGMERSNLSYNADLYNPGSTARQLRNQIGRFDFFRIEGHVGLNVEQSVQAIEAEIRGKNLPFHVRAVALSADRRNVVVKPAIRYTDLHRFHYMLRQDAVSQLEDTKRFSGAFKRQMDDALARNVVVDQSEDTDGASIREIVTQKDTAVTSGATAASTKLNRSYVDYTRDPSWKTDVANTMTAAGELKSNLGKVVKTDFTTPADALIGNNQMQWLSWLDELIQKKEEKEDEKLLFGKFLEQHPGLEHFAGVTRGGTFVLVHDERKIVVADFMLPYVCCDPIEEEPDEPPLTKPAVKPPFVLEQGVKVLPSRERYVKDKLLGFHAEIEPVWKQDVKIERDYVDVFKDSVRLMGSVFSAPTQGPDIKDYDFGKAVGPLLDLQMRDLQVRAERVDLLRKEMLKPDVDLEQRKTFESLLHDAEVALAAGAGETTQLIAGSKLDVRAGSAGFAAMSAVSESVSRINNRTALTTLRKGLVGAGSRATSPEMKGMITNLLNSRGLKA